MEITFTTIFFLITSFKIEEVSKAKLTNQNRHGSHSIQYPKKSISQKELSKEKRPLSQNKNSMKENKNDLGKNEGIPMDQTQKSWFMQK